MKKITRTCSDNPDFGKLTSMLDEEMDSRYGGLQKHFAPFNKIESNKNVVIAYYGDLPVGCGCYRKFDDTSVEIKRMFVAPGHRGSGLAEILKEIETMAKENGFSRAVLETGIRQPEAIALYQKMGYERMENFGHYAGSTNNICMQKALTQTLNEK